MSWRLVNMPVKKTTTQGFVPNTVWVLIAIVAFSVLCSFFGSSESSTATTRTQTPRATKSSNSSLSKFGNPTSTKVPLSLHACVTDSTIRIRRGPGTQYEVIGGLVSGTCMSILGQSGDSNWVYMTTGEQTGWVAASLLTIDGNLSMVPVSNAYAPRPAYTAVAAIPPAKQKTPKSQNSNSSGSQNQGSSNQDNPPVESNPSGYSAICKDGTTSHAAHRQGMCSHHGGVAQWSP